MGPALVSLGGSNRTFTVLSNSTLGVYGAISDGGQSSGFAKAGPGELQLLAASSYTGFTVVNAGSLDLVPVALGGGDHGTMAALLQGAGQRHHGVQVAERAVGVQDDPLTVHTPPYAIHELA